MSGVDVLVVSGQLLFNAGVLLLAVFGSWRLYRSGRRLELAVIVAALALVLVPSLVVATGRMRIPVTFLIATLAGVGGAAIMARGWKDRDHGTS
jgi:CHASE2 domain-containing sensor protein